MLPTEMDIKQFRQVVNFVTPLEEAVMDDFQAIFRLQLVEKGENFISEGEIAGHVAFVCNGLLRSYYISPKGEEFNKHFFLEGTFLAPLTSLVLKIPSPLYIGTLETTRILIAEFADLESLYDKHLILNKLARKLTEFAWIGKEKRETQLIMLSATDRYQAFLEEYPGLESRIPQYHIASYLGITPVQLSRIRASLNIG